MKKNSFWFSLPICFLLLVGCSYNIETSNPATNKEYIVTFNGNGGTLVSGIEVQKVTQPSDIAEPVYELANHLFVGWDKDIKKVYSNSLIKAQWKKNELSGTDLVLSGFEKNENNTFYKEVDNTTEFYSFLDSVSVSDGSVWHLFKDQNLTEELPGKTISLNVGDNIVYILVTAENGDYNIYTINVRRLNLFIVRFNTNGGSSISPQYVQENSYTERPADPSKRGYTFVDWDYDFSKKVTSSLTINASWSANNYSISFITNGGVFEKEPSTTFVFGSPVNIETISKQGYSFLGWYLNNSLFDSTTWDFDEDIELEARWKAKTYSVILSELSSNTKYYVNYFHNVGSIADFKVELSQDSSVDFYCPPETKSSHFLGWYSNGQLFDFNQKVNNSVDLTAKWLNNSGLSSGQSYIYEGGETQTNTRSWPCYGFLDGEYEVSVEYSGSLTLRVYMATSWTSSIKTLENGHKLQTFVIQDKRGTNQYNGLDYVEFHVDVDNSYGGVAYSVSCKCNEVVESNLRLDDGITPNLKVTYDSNYSLGVPISVHEGENFVGWFTEEKGQGTQLTDEYGNSVSNWGFLNDVYAFPFYNR